MKLFEVLSLSR